MHASHVRAHVHAHEGQCAKVVPQPRKPDPGDPKIEHPSPTPGDIAKRVKQIDTMIAVQRMCGNRAQVEKLTRQREALLSPGSDPPTPKPNGPPPRSNGAGRAQPPPDAGKTDREIMNELNDGLGDLL